jgi:hypothetical protein
MVGSLSGWLKVPPEMPLWSSTTRCSLCGWVGCAPPELRERRVSGFRVEVGAWPQGSEQGEVHPVRLPFPLVLQVIAPVPDQQMVRVHTATVMAAVPDDLVAGGGEVVAFASRL